MQPLARKSPYNREDNTFRNLWGKIETLADSVDVVIEKPRTARRIVHRSTAG